MLPHSASSTLSDMLYRAVARARENHRIRNLKTKGLIAGYIDNWPKNCSL
jgi:hypothetical protein